MANAFKQAAKKAAGKKKAKSKSKTPAVQRDDLDETIDKWLEADKMMKDGKALKEQAESVLLPDVEEERMKSCLADGEHHSSTKVNGKVTVSTKNAYSKIPTSDEEEIKEVIGEDKFKIWFKEKSKIEITPAALADDAFLGKVMEAVGEDFDRYFKVEENLVPTETFHKNRSLDPETKKAFEALQAEGLVKPYKAAVKRA
jgi:hypothetical protein